MKRSIAVYTGTGNSLYAAKALGADTITMVEERSLPDDTEALGLVFPVYCWGVPYPMRLFIREYLAKRDNSGIRYIFAVATYGGFPLSTLADLEMELMDIGLALSYAESVKLPDGYLPLQKRAVSEEKAAELRSEADKKLGRIRQDIEEERMLLPKRGLLYRPMRGLSKLAIKPGDTKLTAEEKCTKCSLCVRICPMGNIKLEDRISFGKSCISCFACYHRCPENAIRYPGAEGQYKGLIASSELIRR